MDRKRLVEMNRFMRLVDRLGMAIITAAISYGAQQVKGLSENVAQLNTSVAVIIERDKSRQDSINDIQNRLRSLESGYAGRRSRGGDVGE